MSYNDIYTINGLNEDFYMSQLYARIVGGKFTTIRYTEEALRFANTIADVVATGDEIYPIIETLTNTGTAEAPVFRDPLPVEIANKVVAVSDLAQPLYSRDLGVAGGVATLDESGGVPKNQLPDEVVEYLGTWDPRSNTPELVDGVGNIGDSYEVHKDVGDTDYEIDLGSGPIFVRGGMTVIYRSDNGDNETGRWAVQGSTGLSAEDRFVLENSMQNVKVYSLECVPAAPECVQGEVILAQVSSADNPYPEYTLVDDGGLSSIALNAMSGELRIDTSSDTSGTYTIQVQVAGSLGQSEPVDIVVAVNATAE